MKTIFLFFLFLFLGLVGCRSQQPFIPMESTTDSKVTQNTEVMIQKIQSLMNEIRVWEQRRDSVSIHDSESVLDSIILYVNDVGEVIAKERYRDKVQKSDRASVTENDRLTEITRQYIDSLLTAHEVELKAIIEKSHQIPVPVERQLTKWEKVKQDVGGISIGILIVIIVAAVIWLIKKIRNQR